MVVRPKFNTFGVNVLIVFHSVVWTGLFAIENLFIVVLVIVACPK